MTRELLALAADWWLPTLGFFLLAAGALLGRTVWAGPQARRISVATAWALVALIGVSWTENRLLVATIEAAESKDGHLIAYGMWLQGFAFLENALLPVAGLVAVIGAATTLPRLMTVFKPSKKEHKPTLWNTGQTIRKAAVGHLRARTGRKRTGIIK